MPRKEERMKKLFSLLTALALCLMWALVLSRTLHVTLVLSRTPHVTLVLRWVRILCLT